MSELDAFREDGDPEFQGAVSDDGEILDGVPVLNGPPRILTRQPLSDPLPVEQRSTIMLPAVQAAAVAASGFVAGAAVVGLVHRRHRRAVANGSRAKRGLTRGGSRGEGRAGELLQIVGSRSLLVDLHLLGGDR